MTDEALDLAEISAHQFTEPLRPPAKPPSMARRAVARVSGKVWFRVGWTCTCVVKVLTTAEELMLLEGLIEDSLDIFQLQGTAAASAGTHSKPGAYDIGQDSPAQIDVQRRCGGDGQARTTSQGFAVKHCHGFAQGCPHGSPGLLSQKHQWNNRQNGLISHGPIQGRWPTKNWSVAVAEQGKKIMALKDDIANEVIARLRKEYDAIADAMLTRDGKIGNTITSNKANKTLTLAGALSGLGINTADVGKQVLGRDNLIPNDDPTDPNKFMAAASALKLLLRRSRQQQAQIDAILTKLEGPQA